MSNDNDYSWPEFVPPPHLLEKNTPVIDQQSMANTTNQPSEYTNVIILDTIVLNIHLKYDYDKLNAFVDELERPNEYRQSTENGQSLSILHEYVRAKTCEPINMGNPNVLTYRPDLCIRKNDAFGTWNFPHLLNLLELDYECHQSNYTGFPIVWKTDSQTKIEIRRKQGYRNGTPTIDTKNKEVIDLRDFLKKICEHNKCQENEVNKWMKSLEDESITTIEHLESAVSNDSCWEKLTSLKYLVKQRIRDYILLNPNSKMFKSIKNSEENPKATLLGDIHRIRRYFHDAVGTLKYVPYLDPHAVDFAKSEMRQIYDDDGNVLNNIHAYLSTFCLRNTPVNEDEQKQQQEKRTEERDKLLKINGKYRDELNTLEKEVSDAKYFVATCEAGQKNIAATKKDIEAELDQLVEQVASPTDPRQSSNESKLIEKKAIKDTIQKQIEDADKRLKEAEKKYEEYKKSFDALDEKIAKNDESIRKLNTLIDINLDDAHRKLNVKYGRGLLLHGPPGTGKSVLLKRAAIYAGITMTTNPLSAGELNRSYVGETERLLVDIMGRAETIPYLICTMTIDEIDGLVPKRDHNAQQSKVDGISVLLSHIEGVKDIPNLIVLGATNRRNMMDEAFLRRMQAKCFVGRPSPQTRHSMLAPLMLQYLEIFTESHINFLVKITTNFSGAAVSSLRSNIIVAMKKCEETGISSNKTLIKLADNVAREYSCWFSIGTLPEIYRLFPNILSSTNQQKYSLELPNHSPSGRILVDLQSRKYLIELTNNKPTFDEYDLDDEETSTLTLIPRFINGCSSRNIDTIQMIDMNFLSKHNAFDDNQISELLSTTFLGNYQ